MTSAPTSSNLRSLVRENPALLLAAALWLGRAAYASFPNLFPEEAYYWSYAKHLDYGYLDHPPMVAWLIALGTRVFGDTPFGVRVFALLASLVTSFFAFRLTALLYGRRAAAMAVLAVQILPFFFLAGLVMTPDAPLTACWAAMLYFLACAIFEGRTGAWWGVGVALGLGMLSKYTIALLGPATLLFLALDPASRFWFRRAAPYGAVALSAVIFSPVIVWNAAHHWASFAFQTTDRTRVRRHFALHELAGAIVGVLTPVGVWLAGLSLWPRRTVGGTGAASPLEPTPLDAAATLARRRQLFAQVFTLVPLAVFVLFSLTHRVKLNWTGPLWLAVIPALAARLASMEDAPALARRVDHFLRLAWRGTVSVCILLYAALLQHLSFGLPGVRYARNTALLPVGWPELAREVEAQKAALERATGGPVYVVGMDRNFIASELAFYGANPAKSVRETTGSHLFGGDSLMYSYWFPPADLEGANLLLVGFQRDEVSTRRVSKHCPSAGPLLTHSLRHGNQTIRSYYTRAAYNYQSRNLLTTP